LLKAFWGGGGLIM